jgi:UDP-2-acetamido-3-amino-2,3-dideoxy-glucuronate N-acetyltransferase
MKVHKLSDVQSQHIGEGTTIWQFSVILENAVIGKNCNINCNVFIENDVLIGDNVTIKSGVQVWDGVSIENNVFIGPNVTFTNDLRPRSKVRVSFKKTIIKEGASIGANSTILAGVTVGKYSMIGMGSVTTKDVPDYALVYGNPAKFRNWIDENGDNLVKKDGTNEVYLSITGSEFREVNNKMIKL